MAYSYDELQGSPMDPQDHPADSGHNNDQYAGDLVFHPILSNPSAAAQTVVNQVKSGVHGSLPGDSSDRTNVIPLVRKPK